jgi:hypothetical protein
MKISNKYFLVGAIMFCVLLLLVLQPPTIYYLPRGVQGNSCINNLRQIDAAAQEFALEKGKTNGEAINFLDDLTPYIKLNSAGKIPLCPQGGIYTTSSK